MSARLSFARPWSWCFTVATAIVASLFILAAYSSWNRPIWIDEFLHYALGSHRSTAEAWASITATIPVFNHGQTGIYMLVDYWLLHAFGADAHILRLPSYCAAAFMFFSAVQIALRLRFNAGWSLLLLGAFFCQTNLMSYAGEARPYMPLAAATVGTLAFYLVPCSERTLFSRICGGISLCMGVLFHPFYPVYWLSLALFTFFLHSASVTWRTFVPAFVRHCDAWLSIPLSIGCLILAKFTWLLGSPTFGMDPFQWIKADGIFVTFTRISHVEFLGPAYLIAPISLGLGLLAVLTPPLRRSPVFKKLGPPLLLLAVALLLSLFVSVLAYRRHYWILPRQWVASMALCPIAIIWLFKVIADFVRVKLRFADLIILGIAGYFILQAAPAIYRQKRPDISRLLDTVTGTAAPHPVTGPLPSVPPEKVPGNNDEWVNLANANITEGGKVWPIFRKFYARPD